MCMIVCQISAKVLVCARDRHLDSPISLSTSHHRVLTYNCKVQCKRAVCKQYAQKVRYVNRNVQRRTMIIYSIIYTTQHRKRQTKSTSLSSANVINNPREIQ